MSFVPSFPSDCSLACTDSDSHKRADDIASLGTVAAGVGMAAGTTAYAAYKVAQRKDKNQTPQVASNARSRADFEHSPRTTRCQLRSRHLQRSSTLVRPVIPSRQQEPGGVQTAERICR